MLDASAALAGGALTVSPSPGSRAVSHETQISMVGVPASEIVALVVTGSRSGTHTGRLFSYSQGDGASFVPERFFDQGERVTVTATLLRAAARLPVSWSFTVAERDTTSRSLETPPPPPPPPKYDELQHYRSRPDLTPASVTVTHGRSHSPGYIFLAPYAGPGQYGPMILDGAGRLVWFKPIPKHERAADLRLQHYEGRPVLTWWQEPYAAEGRKDGAIVIADRSYRTIKVVRAGNGYQPDLHAFQIAAKDTAIFTVYDAIRCDLRAYGGPANGAVADTLLQEVDLRTGLVRYEWHALDHVSMHDSYVPMEKNGTQVSPWDWFHINVAEEQGTHPARLLVDSRNTWAAYFLDPRTGQILERFGGKKSSFAMGAGAAPAWQHDLRVESPDTVSFFDNGATPAVHRQSRAIVLHLNARAKSATLASSFVHSPSLVVPSQGSSQPLAGGNWFVGWGQEPYMSEYAPHGQLLFDAHMPKQSQSYTALKFPWVGAPRTPPALVLTHSTSGHTLTRVSWNGSTETATWRLLGGAAPNALRALLAAPRAGFETSIALPSAPRYVQAQALDASGRVLADSRVVAG